MFLEQYLMFLFKALTIMGVLFVILFIYSYIKLKLKGGKEEGVLTIKDLSGHYNELKLQMIRTLPSKKEAKQAIKDLKKTTKEQKLKKDKVASYVIKFNGDIKANAVESLKEEINAVLLIASQKDKVILVLESPGGTVNGYGLASSELSRIKKKSIKLIVAIDKVAASGGYLMACIANKIIAAPFAIIGSIGVLSQTPNFYKLLKDKGVEFEQITSGKYKRTVTMFGKNTDEDRKKLQEEITQVHNQFKDLVKKERPAIDLNKISTGEYWLAEKAKELKLVDELMTSDEYLMSLYESGENIYQIEYKKKQTLRDKLSMVAYNFKNIINSQASY
ncbi:protease SohB [Candidatus Bandiella euplotis]|uniref:SohB-like S49 family peptidase n=1 Tax=Candidatus Bandiella euplotis TaxID=1664265 RepID=A0ABZ0UMV4_9RICK|nr:protease SohB [Candidatus Bandiella woodruffii]WPX97480.1 SohB-like S49 family peptidase [Candidatus Bandiella woodruffii]